MSALRILTIRGNKSETIGRTCQKEWSIQFEIGFNNSYIKDNSAISTS
jgi:hypothetical protein